MPDLIKGFPQFLPVLLLVVEFLVELLEHFGFVDDALLVLLLQQLFVVKNRLVVLFLDHLDLFD